MKTVLKILALLLALAIAVWWFSHRPSHFPAEEEETTAAVNPVSTAPITRKELRETSSAYGSVVAKPGRTHAVSVAFESRVRHVLVAPGQYVDKGDALVEIEPSPAARLQLQQAQAAAAAAEIDFKQVRQRYDLKLATNSDLNAATKISDEARLQLKNLLEQGVDGTRPVAAELSGIVAVVNTQDGQLVAGGGPLVELVEQEEIEVRLGVEPGDIGSIVPGDRIEISAVNDRNVGTLEGTVRLVTRSIDPTTRLVDVYVSLPEKTKLLLGAYVRGEMSRVTKDAVVVPRSALLPADGKSSLFTIKDGHAVGHVVETGLETNGEVQILGTDLKVGEPVVTSGNYELEDGAAVEVEGTK